ncbi:formylglycine-generating enzyme family protein [Aetokthonos hydrillicola Thurmond2011]|jgi:formylglycine-generating enzyme required for sulfatase activity|uniref:Formylglycine-generating enzyme family protein n=1 Tax=Aetokthonos hydrillicola Thurmond2011 TaxID=2712845 RepID=A0AAP5I419_9CYAN|nr:formylglycine-generating enzyme family protein [Aetokthonos hydrillicola]MBO3459284.1 formylglycine-generating enzyme family protein [Aetokthonos hydrillicola CCALA 1050]MBW4590594.1 formylglycine-generating enzyme family protein [Aetokthonos hydrillicola CCALA 1050]MDR9894359.1 formylglycine-generating enzyme family protein [Aetokthonos hydrillicola Thurmond2011]
MPKIVITQIQKTAKHYLEDLGNGIKLEMVLINGGTFVMGASETEEGSTDDERPQHQVIISPFCMGKYPVTQAQWKAVAALPKVNRDLKADPSYFKGDNLPVEQVSWHDAVEFCDRVTRLVNEHRLSSYAKTQYRLPSEAEWEYSCRAGTNTPFHFGETITTDLANYRGTDNEEYKWSGSYGRGAKGIYREETTVVGSFGVANAFGLYDMHGNVWEWCLDDWHDNYNRAPTDGSPWFYNNDLYQRQGRAVLRGGSWINVPENCRSASRINNVRATLNDLYAFGFRVACRVGKII